MLNQAKNAESEKLPNLTRVAARSRTMNRNTVVAENYAQTTKAARMSIAMQASIPLDSKKTNVGRFMEKNLEIMNKENEILTLKANYEKFEEKLKYNQEIIRKLEVEIKKEKNNLREICHLRKNFLVNLLKQGTDSGLINN